MRNSIAASALLFTAAFLSTPAAAQSATASEPSTMCPSEIGKKAQKALLVYSDAVAAGDAAGIATGKAAAHAESKTDAERCVLAQIDYNAAVKASDNTQLLAAIEALAANPVASKAQVSPLMLNAAKVKFGAKDYAGAAAILEKITAADPTSGEAMILLAGSRFRSGRKDEAPAIALKAIAAEKAAGRKADQTWYKEAVAMAYEIKSPLVVDLAREWVSAYPTSSNWRDALQMLDRQVALSGNDAIDLYRLKMATKGMAGTADYANYVNLTSKLGLPGETEAVIKAGIAAGDLQKGNSEVAGMLSSASAKVGADKASLGSATAKAIASGNAKNALVYGDANYGYGDYAKAAEAYRAAAGMGGDTATANLRLGMALAMSGDTAGATTALNAVTGPKAPIAKYWLAFLNSRG